MKKLLVGFFTVLVLFIVAMMVFNYIEKHHTAVADQSIVSQQELAAEQPKVEPQSAKQSTNAAPIRVSGTISVSFKEDK